MRTIKVKELTKDNFSEFGSFYNLVDLKGNNLGDFYPDHVRNPVSGELPLAFSGLNVHKVDRMIVDTVEYHNYTGEILLPLDTDVVIHVAPASNEIHPEATEAFIVKKGTVVRLDVGVFHLAPFSIEKDEGHVMIALPERTYFNDCVVINYEQKDQIEIVL
jgi:ureidoglycolate lyase